ncbi:MAG: response regulator transcription factor [Syntrophorhabdaceae bacterium]|nr:response regulator transcription factor [Syntrophorhabdaceae bacterium]
MMQRVIIADDHPVVYKGLKEILQENFGSVTVDAAGTGRELIEKVKKTDYDLVLLDISLPDANGLDVLREMRRKRPRLPVLVISMYPEEMYAVRAIRTGAQGYLTKQSASEELIFAVRKILSGRRYVNPAFAVRMVVDFESDAAKPAHEKLSNREFQVMRMFGSGKTMKDIAAELNLSINSIRTYRVRIMEKIGVKGTEGLIHYALTHGLYEYKNG